MSWNLCIEKLEKIQPVRCGVRQRDAQAARAIAGQMTRWAFSISCAASRRSADAAAVGIFIDENAAFLMQKGIYEYSRARAGHYAKVLFTRAGIPCRGRGGALARLSAWACDRCRGGGGRAARTDRRRTRRSAARLERSACSRVFDRYPVPGALSVDEWREPARRACRAGSSSSACIRPSAPWIFREQWAQTYFDLMPIHEKLRGRDFPTTRNYLRAQLCNIHDEFAKRLDPAGGRGVIRREPPMA